MQIPFRCSQCGSGHFRVAAEPKDPKDLYGVPCAECGTPLTEDEVKKQALDIAANRAREAFKNFKV